ncbi:START-2 domain protein [Trifolium medium]|uniref:START-2 domain protein n=1 Tax=Trifolium medium TaxID=97028 RepID=A0A392P4X3_9FABA|nr:START-2 domain protein [Trifolium medium]
MENRKNIVQYRERLDKTLTSFDLTNDQKLKSLVESQFCRSSQSEMELEGYDEKLEIKTAELSNCLDMMRSVSADENGGSSTSHADWKVGYILYSFRPFASLV